ncbi:MAG TPA: lipocalin-like domain-containing protein [Syntrophobacteraceae bacterium]|mgnify:CR=1 FL=1|nr:lipocalin-like domain-containing protein [Syntrophobacteraceae bacterium]
MGKDPFTGAWKLIACEFKSADGHIDFPFGHNPLGMIIYDASGNMAVQIIRADLPKFVSDDKYNGTREEVKAAFEGSLAYFGRYEVDEAAGTVTHHVVGSSFPNWTGSDQTRYFLFSGKQLTLSAPPMPIGSAMASGVLVWERLS